MSDKYAAYEHEFNRILTEYNFSSEQIETILNSLKEKRVLVRNLVKAAAHESFIKLMLELVT